jgi:hypothetical protein
MLRTRRLTVDDVFGPLGAIVLFVVNAGLILAVLVALVCWGVSSAAGWAQKHGKLGPISFAALLAVVVLHFAGCSAAPIERTADPRDPVIWRPAAPAHYPLPR